MFANKVITQSKLTFEKFFSLVILAHEKGFVETSFLLGEERQTTIFQCRRHFRMEHFSNKQTLFQTKHFAKFVVKGPIFFLQSTGTITETCFDR